MDDPALLNLVALLQLPIPLSKFSLSRLYLNLCLHPDTCSLLLRSLLALLRAPIRSGAHPQGIPSNPLPYPAQVRCSKDHAQVLESLLLVQDTRMDDTRACLRCTAAIGQCP